MPGALILWWCSSHGGPGGTNRLAWPITFFDLTVLSSEGYFVFLPNPARELWCGRGVYARQRQGLRLRRLLRYSNGRGRSGKSSPDRSETDRNRRLELRRIHGHVGRYADATVPRGRGGRRDCPNWQSYYGTNGIDQWLIPDFGASVYDDPAVYPRGRRSRSSSKVKTPTLLLVGEGDIECPITQSFEFWHALKTLGVKTKMVVYQDEGHVPIQPKHQRDIMRQTIGWFNENLSTGKGTALTIDTPV